MSKIISTQRLVLAALALAWLPISAAFLLINLLCIGLFPRNPIRRRLQRVPGYKSRTILITGASTSHGLRLARAFHQTGHLVIGADQEFRGLPATARYSTALTRFYALASDSEDRYNSRYIASLVHIVEQHHVDLWIDCSRSLDLNLEAHARGIIAQTTTCQCFALRPTEMPYLAGRESLLKYLAGQGLPIPESHQVTSRAEIHNVLSKTRGSRKFLLQSVEQNGIDANSPKTMLPRRTMSQTYDTVSRISIANTTPWKLEQVINGLESYESFAIIVNGSLKAFVAASTDRAGCYRLLEPTSALSRSMLQFVETFARKQHANFTMHLGIDFCVDEQATEVGVVQTILPMRISLHSRAAIQFFHGLNGSIALTRSYLSCLSADETDVEKKAIRPWSSIVQQLALPDVAMPTTEMPGIYNFGQDLHDLCVEPLHDFLSLKISGRTLTQRLSLFLKHVTLWQEELYDFQDPLPSWLAYQIYEPLKLIALVRAHDNKQQRPRHTWAVSKQGMQNGGVIKNTVDKA